MSHVLLFEKPANCFLEAIPLGNGHIGAMISGGTEKERIYLNDISLWSGKKQDCTNPAAKKAIGEIQKLFFSGKYAEAESVADRFLTRTGSGSDSDTADELFGSYQTLGDLEIFFDAYNSAYPQKYKHTLSMESGICRTSYTLPGNNTFIRECFVSKPDDVFSFRMTSGQEKNIDAVIRLCRAKEGETDILPDGSLLLHGTLPGGLRYAAQAKILLTGGRLEIMRDSIRIRQADELRILLTSATTLTTDTPESETEKNLRNAASKTYEELSSRHTKDFSGLYRRAGLRIGKELEKELCVREIVENFVSGKDSGSFASAFFHFNRYLLISCSRPGNLPANIQGIWCSDYRPPWSSDYHLNVNTQMVYWPAEAANLGECHLPLLEWLEVLARHGAETAAKHFGVRGWCASWIANPWGYTMPGKNLQWGLFPEAGAWMCLHIRDHFEFSGDLEFLRHAFPILRGACEFCLDMLVKNPADGKLLFGPTVPPEHGYLTKDGEHVFVAYGTAAGQEIVYELFRFTAKAADILNESPEFRSELENALSHLALPTADKEGMIEKWILPLQSDGERHLRHTFGHYPGERISSEKTPELIEALKKTLLDHETYTREAGWGAGSWSGVWLIHHWARLGNAEKAFESLSLLLKNTIAPNLLALNGDVFQADGNFGTLSGIIEMLLQSHDNVIRILPALPSEWPEGCIHGIRARGGFEFTLEWFNGTLKNLRVFSANGGVCRLIYGGRKTVLNTERGKTYLLDNPSPSWKEPHFSDIPT